MKRGHDLSSVMKFATSPAWAEHLQDALADHLGPAMEEFEFEFDELADIVGDHWALVLWGCAFEDLMTRAINPNGLNLVDEYIRRRGWNETGPAKLYMRALRSSVMSLYEVSEIEPGSGFLVRDLIQGGEPVRVSERSASQTLKSWDKIGARVVMAGGKHVLSGGVLSFTMEAADSLMSGLRHADGKRSPRAKIALDADRLRGLPSLISTAWLFDVIPRAMGLMTVPTLHNSDGEEVVFHRVRFPFARGVTQTLIGERLDAVPALQRETTHFWNWLGDKPVSNAKGTGQMAWGVTMADGTPVLGNIELKGRALILAVTSAERAARGTTLISNTLADLIGTPLTTIETIEQAMAARRDTPREPAPAIEPDVAAPLVHAMLDRQYQATLDEPVGMLGDITPRAAARTLSGRERLSAWLKHLENRSSDQSDPNDPMATYDFTWMWRELGIENLRR
ncbi:hypothetical protein GS397_26305 (plasmid) [Sphingobium yanoikuyae]|uniref:Uncharacterized protein n=1 Tax=Sphingobium yanoikuyae TaxID=13690 RepID=A0A6P1GPN1_SPHYA|nr:MULTISPECIES: hypothetical protein [Sphingomonadaceae]MBP8235351.1 hypothetical protein [Rhizorhabdus sp.]QHD70626.1 hypothetical protein GS397_26305 [Sphingobium yanoikuyae]